MPSEKGEFACYPRYDRNSNPFAICGSDCASRQFLQAKGGTWCNGVMGWGMTGNLDNVKKTAEKNGLTFHITGLIPSVSSTDRRLLNPAGGV